MEMSPQRVRSAEFKTVRKGAVPDEVRVFLSDVADELERAQNQSAAMEARARAAVARLQEISESATESATGSPAVTVEASVASRLVHGADSASPLAAGSAPGNSVRGPIPAE